MGGLSVGSGQTGRGRVMALSNLGDDVVQTGMLESKGEALVNNYTGHWV